MKTKDIQELYQIKLHSMDTILHQISLMDQVENEQELSEIIHSLLQAKETKAETKVNSALKTTYYEAYSAERKALKMSGDTGD